MGEKKTIIFSLLWISKENKLLIKIINKIIINKVFINILYFQIIQSMYRKWVKISKDSHLCTQVGGF